MQLTACLQELAETWAVCCCLPWCSSYTSQPHPGLLSCTLSATQGFDARDVPLHQTAQLQLPATLQVADGAAAGGTQEKEQDRDADKDKEKERHREKEKEKEKEREREKGLEKPKRVYKTDEGLLVACRYFDRTGAVVSRSKLFALHRQHTSSVAV